MHQWHIRHFLKRNSHHWNKRDFANDFTTKRISESSKLYSRLLTLSGLRPPSLLLPKLCLTVARVMTGSGSPSDHTLAVRSSLDVISQALSWLQYALVTLPWWPGHQRQSRSHILLTFLVKLHDMGGRTTLQRSVVYLSDIIYNFRSY